jgi:lipoprotein-anchoring transpeptidase ErfK/SrfK
VRRVVVSIPDRKLAVIEDGTTVEVYDVAVGKPSTPSPVGTFTIVNRVAHPDLLPARGRHWPGRPQPARHALDGAERKGYGIHGTDQPGSIGYAKSHGCIRLRNGDVERLFERLRAGDVVELHAERTAEIEALFPAS